MIIWVTFKKAKEVLDVLRLPDKERIAYESYVEDLHYQASMFQSSYILMVKKKEKRKVEKKEK